MNTNSKWLLGSMVSALALTATALPIAAFGRDLERSKSPPRLEGTWTVEITPYDCETGDRFPLTIKAYHTFTAGGAVIESTSGKTFQPGQRSAGHGFWERTGRRSFRAVFEGFVLFDSDPGAQPFYQRGVQRFDQGIEFVDATHWQSDALVTFTNEAGEVVPPSGCASVAAERME